MHTSNIDPKQIGYSWVPPGIVTSSKVIENNKKRKKEDKMEIRARSVYTYRYRTTFNDKMRI